MNDLQIGLQKTKVLFKIFGIDREWVILEIRMLEFPNWLLVLFERERFSCPACAADFDPGNITVVGIKNVDHKDGGSREMLYVEYFCRKCCHRIGYDICNMNLREFGNTISNEDTQHNQANSEIKGQGIVDKFKKSNKSAMKERSRSKITIEEKRQVIRSMDECDTWYDWLINAQMNESGKGFHMQ